MALSMEEKRILAEIENELARSEPALAAYLSAFGQAGRAVTLRSPQVRAWGRARSAGAGKRLRSPRVLVIASLAALVLLTIIPVLVYALVSLHPLPRGRSAGRPAVSAQHHALPPHPVMSAPR
jgi:Protein of unknown function (DUF3040)